MKKIKYALALFALFLSHSVGAASAEQSFIPSDEANKTAEKIINRDGFACPEGLHPDEKGWWWGCKEIEQPKPKPEDMKIGPAGPTEEQKEELCRHTDTWDAHECGFIHPSKIKDYKKAFDFQKKQQEELSKWMVMEPENARAVKEYQKYTKWWMRQSVMTSRTWKFNMVQDPDLDPRVKNPVSTYGLRLATDVRAKDKEGVFKVLKEEGAFFTWFTRSDCAYCHSSKKIIDKVSLRTGLDVYNISLDDKCIEGYTGEFCRTYSEEVRVVAGQLGVKVVPTLMMYIPNDPEVPEQGGTWLKIANGVEVVSTIIDRTYSYFKAHKSAIKKGLSSALSEQPAMDWEYEKPTGVIEIDTGKTAASK